MSAQHADTRTPHEVWLDDFRAHFELHAAGMNLSLAAATLPPNSAFDQALREYVSSYTTLTRQAILRLHVAIQGRS